MFVQQLLENRKKVLYKAQKHKNRTINIKQPCGKIFARLTTIKPQCGAGPEALHRECSAAAVVKL